MGKVIVIEQDVTKSKAYRTLSSTAKDVLLDFYAMRQIVKRKTKRGSETVITNNGELQYCYSTALKNDIPRETFKRAIDQLINHGFIEITHQGNGGRKGDVSLYALVENWRQWGTDAFTYKPRVKNRKAGIGFAEYHRQNGTAKINIGNVSGT